MLLSFLGVSFSFEIASKDSATRSRRFQFIRFQSPLCQNMSFNPLFANFNLCFQMCEKHYQKNKEDVDNKHALQALPGFNNQLSDIIDSLFSDLTSWTVFFFRLDIILFSGHGKEYFYEDDGTRTSLCLALSSPDLNVRIIFNFFLLKSSFSAQNLTYM